ncbi:hypothetical protein D3C76_1238260 [compost metagenome]
MPNTISPIRSSLRLSMNPCTTSLTAARRLIFWPLASLKSVVSIDWEMSMASIRSRTGCWRSMGCSTHTGRLAATSNSVQTSRFSSNCQRLLRVPAWLGAWPTARLMAPKNGTRTALRASR